MASPHKRMIREVMNRASGGLVARSVNDLTRRCLARLSMRCISQRTAELVVDTIRDAGNELPG